MVVRLLFFWILFEYCVNSRVAPISVKIVYNAQSNVLFLASAVSTVAYPRLVSSFTVCTNAHLGC